MGRGAEPVVDAAVSGDAEKRPQVARIGLALPILCIIATIAASSALGQPLRGRVDFGELGLWAAGTLLLLLPYAAALAVMFCSRRGGLVWTTALVYTGLSGLLGLAVQMNVLGSESPAATFSVMSALVVQAIVLGPVCAAVAFLIRIVRDSTRQ